MQFMKHGARSSRPQIAPRNPRSPKPQRIIG